LFGKRAISDGFDDFEIVEPGAILDFRDLAEAERFLAPFLQSPDAVKTMRELLDQYGIPNRESDREAVRAFASLLVSGRLKLVSAGRTLKAVSVKKAEAPPPESKPSNEKPEKPKKEPSDAKDVDAAAQADTLKRAAEDGKPFTEECEKGKPQKKNESA
jgi:hypothetical protein